MAETGWLIERQLRPPPKPASNVPWPRATKVQALTAANWERVADLVERYADLGLGWVDASLVVLAETAGATEIATMDHRDFTVVRPVHTTAFELLS